MLESVTVRLSLVSTNFSTAKAPFVTDSLPSEPASFSTPSPPVTFITPPLIVISFKSLSSAEAKFKTPPVTFTFP